MKNTFNAICVLAGAMLAGSAASAAEPQATSAQQATDAEARAKIDAEAQSRNAAQMKIDAEAQARGAAHAKADAESQTRAAAQAKVEAEAQAKSATHAKIDAEAARRDLEQMREQMRVLSKRMAELSLKLGDVGPRTYAYRYFGDPDRGMIGVVLGKDDHGLRINAVTPGGPADKAGVKNGDVIVTVDGIDLTKTPANAQTPQVLHDLKVGQEVKVTVVRDGKKVDTTMKAERREPFNMSLAIDHAELGKLKRLDEMQALGELGAELPPDYERRIEMQVEEATRQAERQAERSAQHSQIDRERSVRIAEQANEQVLRAMQRVKVSMPWWGLNLANLNPDLGAYFGTDHGVLVLSTDADSAKTLKSGDVLMSIGGKPVERPEDALRLLREQPGKDVKIEVLRQRKTQTLSMRAPEFKTMFIPAPPVAPIAPLPPTPATPPAPPPMPPAPHVGVGSVTSGSPTTIATMAPRPPAAATPTPNALPAPPAPAPSPPALRVEPVPAAPAAPANDDASPRGAARSGGSRIA